MAFEVVAGVRRKRVKDPASDHVSLSMSVDMGLVAQIYDFARTLEFSRSEALRYLVEAGLNYETSIVPERRRQAEEMQRLARVFSDLEDKLPRLADCESYYYNNNQLAKADEHQLPAEARAV